MPDTLTPEERLAACPFCGTEPRFCEMRDVQDDFAHGYTISCDICGIEMADEYQSGVAEAWNRRASPPTSAENAEGGADCGSLDNPATFHLSPPPASLDADAVIERCVKAIIALRPTTNPKLWDQWERGENDALSRAILAIRALKTGGANG